MLAIYAKAGPERNAKQKIIFEMHYAPEHLITRIHEGKTLVKKTTLPAYNKLPGFGHSPLIKRPSKPEQRDAL